MAKKILVIDDDKDVRDMVTYVLEDAKYEVAASGEAKILNSINDINPDLILMDNWLTEWKSDANGEQLSRELKSDPATSHIPIVIISAVSNIKEIAESGLADAYLKKPFDVAALLTVVKKHIE
jgi:two-component system phosphate regulon response regulator PhoB